MKKHYPMAVSAFSILLVACVPAQRTGLNDAAKANLSTSVACMEDAYSSYEDGMSPANVIAEGLVFACGKHHRAAYEAASLSLPRSARNEFVNSHRRAAMRTATAIVLRLRSNR